MISVGFENVEYVIETDRLTGGYGVKMVVQCALVTRAAAVYGFLGPNGAGKTTAMRLLLGLREPAAGEAQLFGRPLRESLPDVLRRVGALLEQPSPYEHLSGRGEHRIDACTTSSSS